MGVTAIFLLLLLFPVANNQPIGVFFKRPFDSIGECRKYIKKRGLVENRKQLFADHDMRMGMYRCQRVRMIMLPEREPKIEEEKKLNENKRI